MALEGQLAVSAGDTVDFAFTVSNAGTEPVELQFTSGLVADVAVLADDVEVWRWSADRAFTQAIGTETMLPGESFTQDVAWTDPAPGTYTAVASLAAKNVDVEATAPFEI